MSEIEKLMQNAGIEKDWKPLPYGDIEEYYPEFTAEKQISLIKCLLTKVIDTEHIHLEFSDRTFKFLIHSVACTGDDCDTLENALCSYINNLWQDLTDIEKAEIREILK